MLTDFQVLLAYARVLASLAETSQRFIELVFHYRQAEHNRTKNLDIINPNNHRSTGIYIL